MLACTTDSARCRGATCCVVRGRFGRGGTNVAVIAEQPIAAHDPAGGPNLALAPTFDQDTDGDGVADGWYVDAPRPALRPRFDLDEGVHRSGRWSGRASGAGNSSCFGKWGQ